MPNVVLLFPGQGSQAPGMGKDLAAAFPEAGDVFEIEVAEFGLPLKNPLKIDAEEDIVIKQL